MQDSELVQTAMSVRCAADDHPERIDVLGVAFSVSTALSMILSFRSSIGQVEWSDFQNKVHYYLRLNDGRVLDATIDQFAEALNRDEKQAVYLGPPLACHNAP